MTNIHHEYTDEITCPYCGYAHMDSFEYNQDSTEEDNKMICHNCKKEFIWQRVVTVEYITEEI